MAHTPGPWGVDSYGAQHSLTEFHIIRGSMPIAKVKKTTMNAEGASTNNKAKIAKVIVSVDIILSIWVFQE